jgi:DNA-directed RNA polymerase subunit RPC12/RpoP
MVHYGFYCPDCKKAFSNVFEHRKDAEVSITCPHCGSRKVQHLQAKRMIVPECFPTGKEKAARPERKKWPNPRH